MIRASLKRKLSRLLPCQTQPSSSDDDEPIGALGAYDRLLELSVCPASALPVNSAVDGAPSESCRQAAAGNGQEGPAEAGNATGAEPGRCAPCATAADDSAEKPVTNCYVQHLEAELSPEQQHALQDQQSISWHSVPLEGWNASQLRQDCELQGCFRASAAPTIRASRSLQAHDVKPRLRSTFEEVNSTAAAPGLMSQPEASFFALCEQYCDVVHACHPYPTAPMQLSPEESAVLLHAANHIAKKMDTVKKNHERLEKETIDSTAARDQGFVRPQVLLLAPMRSIALPAMLRFAALAQRENRNDSIRGKQQLMKEFSEDVPTRKDVVRPADHKAMFSGNSDDHFQVKFFTDVYDSDVIVASPLALATQLGEGGAGAADYLSSIELLVMLRSDVMQMQNWAHVETVFESLNKMPTKQHDSDIMRVRAHLLEELGRMYRQTIIFTSFESPEMNALVHSLCNHSGIVNIAGSCPGVLNHIVPKVHHLFQSFTAPSCVDAADRRFEHFVMHLWPRIADSRAPGVLLFASSYFDFVRLRNFLKSKAASFAVYCEYTEGPSVLRARMRFANQERRLLLYTERAHFYFRPVLRGVHEVVFYSLPQHAGFYEELVNMAHPRSVDQQCYVHTLFSSFDFLRLKKIIGLERSKRMIKAKSKSFLFKVE